MSHVLLVTGAAGGLGRAIVARAPQTGASRVTLPSVPGPIRQATDQRRHGGLPDKQSAANPVRQGTPNEGGTRLDHPLARVPSRNRPALGASSNEGDRDSGTQSNRAGWPGRVREGGTLFLIRRNMRRTGDAVGGGRRPRGDRTQISERPQGVKSLHKCALDLP